MSGEHPGRQICRQFAPHLGARPCHHGFGQDHVGDDLRSIVLEDDGHENIGDAGNSTNMRLDFHRFHQVAPNLDGVVDASPKLQFSAFVDAAPVTGPVDAHSVAQARESCCSSIRVAVVSVGKITGDNLNLSDLSVGEIHAVHIDDLYVLAVASTSGRYHSDG